MHTRFFDFAQGRDGPFQFAFERAPVVHLFREIGGGEIGLIEQLKPDASGFRKPFASQQQPRFRGFVGRDHDRIAVVLEPVLDVAFLEFLNGLRGVFAGHAAIESFEIRVGGASSRSPEMRRRRGSTATKMGAF